MGRRRRFELLFVGDALLIFLLYLDGTTARAQTRTPPARHALAQTSAHLFVLASQLFHRSFVRSPQIRQRGRVLLLELGQRFRVLSLNLRELLLELVLALLDAFAVRSFRGRFFALALHCSRLIILILLGVLLQRLCLGLSQSILVLSVEPLHLSFMLCHSIAMRLFHRLNLVGVLSLHRFERS